MFGRDSTVSHEPDPSHTRSLPHFLPLNLGTIYRDLGLDVASDARLIDDKMAEREWVCRLRGATGGFTQLKLAALASLILLCLICAGCPDESQQQQQAYRNAHPHSVAVAEQNSASTELGCAGAAILAAFLFKRRRRSDKPNGLAQSLSD